MKQPIELKSLINLPILNEFNSLRFGDELYSRQYGLGKFVDHYNDQAVVHFSDRSIRISPGESDISLIPKDLLLKQKARNVGYVNGEKVSLTKLKKAMRENIKHYVPANQAAEFMGISKQQFVDLCKRKRISINQFGIHQTDLITLMRRKD